MWTVTAEASADQVYEALKQAFDEGHVPKDTKTWTTRGRNIGADGTVTPAVKEHTKPVHKQLSGKERTEQDDKALKFRHGLKMVQQRTSGMPASRKVKATISGDTKMFSVKIEEA